MHFLTHCGACCVFCITLLHFLNEFNHCTPYLSGEQKKIGQVSAVEPSGTDLNTDFGLAQEESVKAGSLSVLRESEL